jgi:hypothetical protein
MASHQDEIPSIHMFFESHSHDVLLACLYQDILRYARSVNPDFPENPKRHRFTAWELTEWLIDNHREYIEHYKDLSTRNTPKRVRIASRQDRIKEIIEKFIELQLIERREQAKARRGDTITTYYYFTLLGYMLAWIVQSFVPENHDISEQKIYNIMDYQFKYNDPTSRDIFYSTLFKKFKEKGVYTEFVISTLKDRINSNAPIWTMEELLESLIFTDNTSNPELYRDLWKETMNQIPDGVKIFFLHDLKLDTERRVFEIVTDIKRYERKRYELREKYDALAVEAKCEKCLHVRYIEINTLKYFGIIDSTGLDEVPDICPQCQSHNTTVISNYR